MAGLGSAPLGSSPLGLGTPASATSPAQPATDEALLIDARTRRYVVGADGNLVRTTRAGQLVYLALFTEFGSSAQADLGLFPDPRVITDDIVTQMQDRVNRALKPLVTQGLIEILSVIVTRSKRVTTRMERRVVWRDLSTGQEQPTPF